MKDPIVKNQHYVPRFILKNFSFGKKEQLHVYDKKDAKIFVSKSKNIASETYFYDFQINGEKHSLEKNFELLENHCALIIKKIIKAGTLEILTDQEIYDLSHFTAVQFTRTRKMRNMHSETKEILLNHMKKMGIPQDKIDSISSANENELQILELQVMIDHVPKFTEIISRKFLTLMKAPSRSSLYISDHPVVMDNNFLKDSPYRSNLGLAVTGIEIYFPIHPEYILCFMCPEWAQTVKESYEKILKLIHLNPSVISRLRPDSIYEMYETIYKRKTFNLRHENVVRLNSIQAVQSTRFIFSHAKDFSLLEEMQDKGHINKEGRTLGS